MNYLIKLFDLFRLKNMSIIGCFYILFMLCLILISSHGIDDSLEVMDEQEIDELLKEEKYVVTLFSENQDCSGECSKLETSLVSVREELVEGTGAWVVRSHAPRRARQFGVRDSAVIFMRSGAPLLYSGPSDDEDRMLTYLLTHKESVVKHLNDITFEHQTQASTGATTGDWLIMFVKEDCVRCQQLRPTIEAVAADLLGRKNVAIVNREDDGAVTARRFGAKDFPAFVLFRLGRMYRYEIPVYDVSALRAFAEDGFHNAKALPVPTPKSPFDDVTEAAADWLKENPSTFLLTVGGIILAIAILVLLNRPPPESWVDSKKKKKL